MLTLEETKLHLRVDHDFEDAGIEAMIDAAIAAVSDYLGVPIEDLELLAQPAPVRSAALLQVSDLYENRERQTAQALHRNDTFERLLNPYRVMAV